MLEEVGRPYEIRVLDLKKGENQTPEYLAVNPMGKVPALLHGGVAVTEASAICCYLADAFPEAGLTVPVGDPRRGPYLKWLFFSSGCIEPARSEEHTSELQSLMRISYAVFCLKKKKYQKPMTQ